MEEESKVTAPCSYLRGCVSKLQQARRRGSCNHCSNIRCSLEDEDEAAGNNREGQKVAV